MFQFERALIGGILEDGDLKPDSTYGVGGDRPLWDDRGPSQGGQHDYEGRDGGVVTV